VTLVFVLCLDPERSREILECDTLIVIAIERLKTRFAGVNALLRLQGTVPTAHRGLVCQ
jgi:hypothetical protein